MTLPRGVGSLWKHSVIFAVLVAGRAGSPLHAQDTTTPNNAPPASPAPSTNVDTANGRPDTTAARPDSLAPGSLAPDSLSRRTVSAGTRAPRDRHRRAQLHRLPRPHPRPPRWTACWPAACRESGGEPPDLLTVVFRPTATAEERQKAARDVGGIVLEQSRHQAPGAWYVQVPGSGRNPLVADRLILLPPVLEVGATRCPS